jgi:hypothetical protein
MPPDFGWAEGTFARLRAALEAGNRVFFTTYRASSVKRSCRKDRAFCTNRQYRRAK